MDFGLKEDFMNMTPMTKIYKGKGKWIINLFSMVLNSSKKSQFHWLDI